MRICISDTNIFIDLINIDLLDAFLELPYEIQTTDFVLLELNDEQLNTIQTKIDLDKIAVNSADEKEIEEIVNLQKTRPSLSIEDFSVYFFAKKNNATILTGDKTFRAFAEQKKIEVNGILWIFDEIEKSILKERNVLADRLEKLTTINTRLPKDECEKRIKLWKG